MIFRGCMSLAYENFAFGELKMLNFRPFFSLNLYVHEFWSLNVPLSKKILHLVSYYCLISRLCFKKKSQLKSIWFFGRLHDSLPNKVFSHWCRRFYMLGGKAGETVSRRETPSQCWRVGSPAEAEGKNAIFKLKLFNYQAFVNILLKIHFSFPIKHWPLL